MPSETLSQDNSTELKLTPEGEAAALSVVELAHKRYCGDPNCGYNIPTVSTEPSPVPAPQLPTRKQLGQLRRRYLTIVHGVVRACGHKAKFSSTKQPTNNCVDCWTAYFASTDATGKPIVDLLGVHKLLTEKGVKGLESQYGTKFTKNFHGFLALYLKEQREVEDPQEAVVI